MNKIFVALLSTLILFSSCNREKRYIYQVEEQELYQNASEKRNLKSTTQFISIAYNDLFGTAITTDELTKFDIALQAFGDKAVLQDMIVKSMINRGGVQIIDNNAMRADVSAFVESTYLRFYNRKPTEFEAWKMKDMIDKNADISPKMVYYTMMTSNEYRYY